MAGADGGFVMLLLSMAVILYVNWMRVEWHR
jgi:hypothetical protein